MRDLKEIVDALALGKTVAPPKYDGKDARRLESTVELGKHEDGVSTVQMEMSVSHSKEGKRFLGYVQIMSVKSEGAFVTKSFQLYDKETSLYLGSAPCARYSAKALNDCWQSFITDLLEDPALLSPLNLDHNQAVAA